MTEEEPDHYEWFGVMYCSNEYAFIGVDPTEEEIPDECPHCGSELGG